MLNKEQRQKAIKHIISFFHDERGEEIGVIAAEAFLDFFLKDIGKDIYKKGIIDAKTLLKERMEDLSIDLDMLHE